MSKPESGDDATKTEMDLIGRSDGAPRSVSRSKADGKRRLTIRMLGQFLSKEHAQLRREGSGWTIKDLAPGRNRRLASVDSRAAR